MFSLNVANIKQFMKYFPKSLGCLESLKICNKCFIQVSISLSWWYIHFFFLPNCNIVRRVWFL